MFKLRNSHVVIAGILLVALWAPAQAIEINKNYTLTLNDSQVVDNNLPINDVWESGLIDINDIVTLQTGDSFVANINFADMKHLELDDGFIDGQESIKIKVDGEGGVGGLPNNKAYYSFLFTDVEGGPLLENPITGQLTIGALNGNVDFDRDLNLINGEKVQFHDIHLTLTSRSPNNWSFNKFSVGVDADVVSVPEPPIVFLFSAVFIGTMLFRLSRKKERV